MENVYLLVFDFRMVTKNIASHSPIVCHQWVEMRFYTLDKRIRRNEMQLVKDNMGNFHKAGGKCTSS